MTTERTKSASSAARPRSSAGALPHPSVDERASRGAAARRDLPLAEHGVWEPQPRRADPVELLEEQARTRIPELVPIRYGRMLVSPFTFYRGGAYLMASDLARLPRAGLDVQLCGDAHLSNFGAFASPDRRLVVSINDFDETLPGPFEWDVKRLAASFAVAGRDRGFDAKQRRGIIRRVVRAYREAMASFAGMRNLDVWYARLEVDELVSRFGAHVDQKTLRRFEKNVAKARTKDSLKALGKLTTVVDGEHRFVSETPFITPIEELVPAGEAAALETFLHGIIRSYRRTLPTDRRHLLERFRYVHTARKVVGVGSVGTRAFIMLLTGRDDEDPLFLQLKEAQTSVLEPFLGTSEYASHGQRVVEGQRLMQATSDIMLGWIRTKDTDGVSRDFYVRQLWDAKGSALVDVMGPEVMRAYARICGWTLARAHARSGDAVAIAGYLGADDTFDRALASFAEAYADQNVADFEALRAAASAGVVAVEAAV
jgi:uncharacterized protein (DUF2252 family)